MTCPDTQTLKNFVAARLESVEEDSLLEHLETCADCRRHVEQLEREGDSLSEGIRDGLLYTPKNTVNDELADLHQIGQPEEIPSKASLNMPETIGPYKIVGFLGHGGMGNVYKGIHPHLKRDVAIKVIREVRTDNPNAVARFRREMEAIGKLHHPNIVSAFDAGEENGRLYIVMELLEGNDLSRYVSEHGPLNVELACKVIEQTARGLQYAHQAGLIHRDIKPSNLWLTCDETAKILDLGLARLQEQESESPNRTETGVVAGTPEFMAPEQVGDFCNVDHRSDIYSLGCTFFYLLTGKAPFAGKDYFRLADKIAAHARDEVPALSKYRNDVPEPVEAILRKMMAKKPEDRFQNASEIAFPTDVISTMPKNRQKQRGLLLGGTVLTVCVFLAVLFGVSSRRNVESSNSNQESAITTTEAPLPMPETASPVMVGKTTEQTEPEPVKPASPPAAIRNISLKSKEFAPLVEGVKAKDLEAIRTFFEADPGLLHARYDFGNTFLHLAAALGMSEFAEYLLEKGLDINVVNMYGQTPLHSAAYNAKDPKIVKTLLDHGATIELVHGLGWTPLHCAANKNTNAEIAKCLIDHGADINAKDPDGRTPLHLAVKMEDESENIDVAKLLIEKGADVNAKDKQGQTPLHVTAFNHKHDDAAKLLIEKKADINAKNAKEQTPYKLASGLFGNTKVRDVLVAAGAERTDAKPGEASGTSTYVVTSTFPSGVKKTETYVFGGETQVAIKQVTPDSTAAKLGLQPGDIINRYDNKIFSTPKDFIDARSIEPPDGSPKELIIKRGEEILTFQVKPGLLGALLEMKPKPTLKQEEPSQVDNSTIKNKLDPKDDAKATP